MPNYGLLTNMASGIREAMTAYQTIQKDKRDQKMMGLLQGVQEDPVTGEMKYTPEKQQQINLQNKMAQRQMDAFDPNSSYSQNQRQLTGSILGGKVSPMLDGMSAADISENQPLFNTKLRADEIATNRGLLNQQRSDAAKEKKDAKDQEQVYKYSRDLKDDLDPNKARGGNLAKSQAMINSADRVDGLFKQFPDYNIPKGQSVELASAIAGLINGGSAQSQHQIDQLTPQSMRGNAQAIAGWLTNEPTGMQQQAYMKMMHETALREREIAEDQVKTAQVQRLGAYQGLIKSNPKFKDEYDRNLQSFNINPADIIEGRYVPPKRASHDQTPAATPKIRRGKDGKNYQQIGPDQWIEVK